MSTIVVVKKAGKAAIAADTLTSFGSTKFSGAYSKNKNKILKFKDNYIGLVGSAAHNNVFQSIIRNYSDLLSFNSRADIFDTYLKLHPVLKERYFLNADEGKDGEQDYESSQINAVIANPHGVFAMFSWREVYEYDRFWAIGSGRDYALGAMFGVYDRLKSADEIARIGVSAGIEFDDSSAQPYTIYEVELHSGRRQSSKVRGRGSKA